MKQKKLQEEELVPHQNQRDKEKLELDKAVAQAWHSHYTKSMVVTSEFDFRKHNFQSKPTRFKLEALKMLEANEEAERAKWEFYESLWDCYEIVAVSKKLENGFLLDYKFEDVKKIDEMNRRVSIKKRESKNSLRKLFQF